MYFEIIGETEAIEANRHWNINSRYCAAAETIRRRPLEEIEGNG